ncbi:MAG: hypothetical protein R6X25_06580 [Candidatus Krumholzibacteriia bacterium]
MNASSPKFPLQALTATALTAFLLVAGGCVQVSMVTEIQDDGSGTSVISYSMSDQVANALEELAAMENSPTGEGVPSFDELTRERVEATARAHGASLESFERERDGGRQGATMKIAFENVEQLSRTLNELGEGGDELLVIRPTGDGDYLLAAIPDPRAGAEAEDDEDEEEAADPGVYDPESMQRAMELTGQLMANLSELEMEMKITVPGDILESSAHRVDGRTAVWRVDSSNMMSMQDGDFDPRVRFSGKGVKIGG